MRRLVPVLTLGLAAAFLAPAANLPRPASEFEVKLPTGRQVNVNDHRGKVVVVEILLTTCPHCQKSARILSSLYKEYGPKGLQPIGAAINDNALALVPDFVKAQGVTYPVGVARREDAYRFLQHDMMRPMQMPQLVFIDRKGMIRAQYTGVDPFFTDEERNMRAMIETLLKEPAGAAGSSKAQTPKKGTK